MFRVGWKALVGSVGYGKFNKDHEITALRNHVHVLKGHCQNTAEAGPAPCLRLGCYCSASVCTVCPPWLQKALQTLSIMGQKPPEGSGVLGGKECKVQ